MEDEIVYHGSSHPREPLIHVKAHVKHDEANFRPQYHHPKRTEKETDETRRPKEKKFEEVNEKRDDFEPAKVNEKNKQPKKEEKAEKKKEEKNEMPKETKKKVEEKKSVMKKDMIEAKSMSKEMDKLIPDKKNDRDGPNEAIEKIMDTFSKDFADKSQKDDDFLWVIENGIWTQKSLNHVKK